MEKIQIISNPYEYLGTLCNEGIDFVIKQIKISDQVSIQNIIEYSSNYALNNLDLKEKIYLTSYYTFISNVINELEIKSLSDILKYANLSEFSICTINNILHYPDNVDYPSILKFLNNTEENILNANISEIEKQYPLLFVAIAQKSINYWMEQVTDAASSWRPFVEAAGMTMNTAKWTWKEGCQGALAGMHICSYSDNNLSLNSLNRYNATISCSVATSIAVAFNKLFKN